MIESYTLTSFFSEFPQSWKLKTSPRKTGFGGKTKLLPYRRMKTPTAFVGVQHGNRAKKTYYLFIFRRFWVKEALH